MPFYGPVLVPLGPFPMAMGGTIDYQETLTVDPSKLRPLENRVIVLHGLRVGGEHADRAGRLRPDRGGHAEHAEHRRRRREP